MDMNSTLAAIRDALLPKLVSGVIRLKDAEQFTLCKPAMARQDLA